MLRKIYIIAIMLAFTSCDSSKHIQDHKSSENTSTAIEKLNSSSFVNDFLSFSYPASFKTSYEAHETLKVNTLKGDSTTIVIYEMDQELKLEDFARAFINNMNTSTPEINSLDFQLGNETLPAKKATINNSKEVLILEVKNSAKKTLFVSFEKLMTKDGDFTEETKSTMQLINSTINYK
ncbi:hypothetical protein [uncultured Dokdonia sp.]|uniref:hypothetical protein n=1 Tax=Dokdonia sp. R78006 TaxID=3093866 RepID=UPI0026277B9B|nr:hypothetical protein [uncultured Dokdonia sp.]